MKCTTLQSRYSPPTVTSSKSSMLLRQSRRGFVRLASSQLLLLFLLLRYIDLQFRKKLSLSCRKAERSRRLFNSIRIYLWRIQGSLPMAGFLPIKQELRLSLTGLTTMTTLLLNMLRNTWQRQNKNIPREEEWDPLEFQVWLQDSIIKANPDYSILTHQDRFQNGGLIPAGATPSKWLNIFKNTIRIICQTKMEWSWWSRLYWMWLSQATRTSSWWWSVRSNRGFSMTRRSSSWSRPPNSDMDMWSSTKYY